MAGERPISSPQTGRLWQNRDFTRLWAGQTISMFGSLVGRIALPMLVVLLLEATPMQVGILRALEVAPGLLVGLFAGVWVDRLRRRPILIGADLGRAVLLAAIPALYLLGRLQLVHVYAVALVVSVLTVLFDVAYQAYLPTLVAPGELVDANSRLEASASVAEVTGFGLAGFLVQFLTAPLTILIDALSFVVSALSLATIRWPEPVPDAGAGGEGSTWQEIRQGMQALFGHPILRALVGAVLAGPLLRRFGFGRTLLGASLLGVVGTAFLPLAGGPLPLVLAVLATQQLVGDGAMTVFSIHSTSLRQAVTPNRVLGRVNATLRVTDWSCQLVGTLLGGVLGEWVGLRGALVVAVAGKLLVVLWLAVSPVPGVRGEPGAPEQVAR